MMMDILLENDDLKVVHGDLVVGGSKKQQQYLLLATDKGEWKQHPRTGVGLFGFLEDENPTLLFREIREQFAMDGLTVKELDLKKGKLQVKAE